MASRLPEDLPAAGSFTNDICNQVIIDPVISHLNNCDQVFYDWSLYIQNYCY